MWTFKNNIVTQNEMHTLMSFDMEYICENVGEKIRYRDSVWDSKTRKYKTVTQTEVILSIPQTKRIMKYICQNCLDDDVLNQLQEYLKENSQTCLDIYLRYRK